MSIEITNKQFLAALRKPGDEAGLFKRDFVQWICHYPGSNENWNGRVYKPKQNIEHKKQNTFFSISMFQPAFNKETNKVELRRKKANFTAMLCVVLDDVGTKADVPNLEPTWILETSPGNQQWGYILEEPITDVNEADNLIKAVIAAGLCDKSANGPSARYMRLPVGSNGKPKHVKKNNGKPIPHVLKSWHPDRLFTVETVVTGLGLHVNSEHNSTERTDEHSLDYANQPDCMWEEKLEDEELIKYIATGESYHNSLLVLAARYITRGEDRNSTIMKLQSYMKQANKKDDRWKNRYKDIPRLVDTAIQKYTQRRLIEDIAFVDFSSLATAEPPAREWIIQDWLPRGTLTLLAGAGGVGKSLLAQQLAIDVANGKSWMGLETKQGNVIGMFCEDDSNELLRRASGIFKHRFYDPTQASKSLYIDARAGKYNTLVSYDYNKDMKLTELMNKLHEQCKKLNPVLVILDNVAQMYAGAEIDRVQVTAFCNALTDIALKFNCAVLLLSHPAKAEGSEYSGSTAWEAAVRARLFLKRCDDDTLTLAKSKANYAALDAIDMRYQDGVFVLHGEDDGDTDAIKEAEELVLHSIKLYTKRQTTCSHSPQARNFLPKEMEKDDCLGKFKRKTIEKALNNLIDKDVVLPNQDLGWRNSGRHKASGLKINDSAINFCGEVDALQLEQEYDDLTALA